MTQDTVPSIHTQPRRVQAYVGGWIDLDVADNEIRNPADTRELIARSPRASAEAVDEALAVARAAASAWTATPAPARGAILGGAAELMATRAPQIATAMTREMGKILAEAEAEVLRTVEILRFFSQAPKLHAGATFPVAAREEIAMTLRVPLGVVGLITPWNFPLAIPSWKTAAALAFGNAVVLKPAELAPLSAAALVECLVDAGLPPGALSLLPGSGSVIGTRLAESPVVAGLSFTGSTSVGRQLEQRVAGTGKSLQCEMGGRNAIVVLADADLDAAVKVAMNAGFGTTGQRCTASSRVIVERPIVDEFTGRLLQATRRLNVGRGLDPAVDVGPLASRGQRDEVLEALTRAVDDGTEVLCGGRVIDSGDFVHGHFMEPAITRGPVDSWFASHEIFGPVLSVFEARDFSDALRINNAVPYGLTSAIFTADLRHAMRFIHEADTGMVHVNRPTVGAEPHVPFGGAKDSAIGPPELGAAWQFYTKSRSAHVRWGW